MILIDLNRLRPNKENPRRVAPKKVESLAISLLKNPHHFLARPIICDKNYTIYAGHQRFLAAKKITKLLDLDEDEKFLYESLIGFDKVPCEVLNLPEEKMREIMIRDNVSAGEWDTSMMADWDLEQLEEWGLDFRHDGRAENEGDEQEEKPSKKRNKTCPNCGHKL